MTKIIQDIIPKGSRNRPGRANPCKYITIHNSGNSSKGAGAKAHVGALKGSYGQNTPASWHYSVDEKEIYQHLPDNETAYHAGGSYNGVKNSGVGNSSSIGIEIMMNSDGDLRKATDNAVELTAILCKKYAISVANIKQHKYWSGKICPQMLLAGKPYTWETFIAKVNALLTPTPMPAPKPPVSKPPTPAPTFKEYQVRVTASGLNVRKTAGVLTGKPVKVLPKGTKVTIVGETKDKAGKKWGKLKDGSGWVHLGYTAKV